MTRVIRPTPLSALARHTCAARLGVALASIGCLAAPLALAAPATAAPASTAPTRAQAGAAHATGTQGTETDRATTDRNTTDDFAVGDAAYVDVAVATLWSKPGLARSIDAPSLSNPVDLRTWNLNLQHTANREWLSAGSKLETQALFGARVDVRARDGEWAKVVVHGQPTPRDARGYPGWVPARQLVENPDFGRRLEQRRRAVVTDRTTWLSKDAAGRNPSTEISMNTSLPVLGSRPGRVRVALPDGGRAWVDAHDVTIRRPGELPPAPSGQDIVDTGSRFLGLRYLWAGASAFGFDCSGFTHTVFAAHGITIPRDSGPQSRSGVAVERANLRPGDLVFFAGPGGVGSVHHVAIYVGGGKILHSPNSARNVEIVDLDHFDVTKEYSGARRYL